MVARKTKQIKVTLKKSASGRLRTHKGCITGLGLRHIGHSVNVADTRENRGMINKVSYLLAVEKT